MKISKLFALLFALLFFFPLNLRAEWFDGDVQEVDLKNKTITLSEVDPITEAEEKKEILVGESTIFSGVNELKDVRKNDNATVEARYDDEADVWKAVSIEVAQAGA